MFDLLPKASQWRSGGTSQIKPASPARFDVAPARRARRASHPEKTGQVIGFLTSKSDDLRLQIKRI